MWDLWLSSTRFQVRPSTLLDVQDPYQAFCLDQAVRFFGSALEAELEEASSKEKTAEKATRARQAILDRVLFPGETPKKRYADPAAKFA